MPFGLGVAKNCNSANKYWEKSCAPNCFHIKLVLVLQNHKIAFAMENQQLSQQHPDHEPKRLEYRSPSVAKLGKLADLTLTVGNKGNDDGGMGTMDKTG